MRRGVIKKVFMTALLGLTVVVPSPASAASDEVIGECAKDLETGVLLLRVLHSNTGAALPADIVPGETPCLEAVVQLKRVGFKNLPAPYVFPSFRNVEGIDSETAVREFGQGEDLPLRKRTAPDLIFVLTCSEAPCLAAAVGSE